MLSEMMISNHTKTTAGFSGLAQNPVATRKSDAK